MEKGGPEEDSISSKVCIQEYLAEEFLLQYMKEVDLTKLLQECI